MDFVYLRVAIALAGTAYLAWQDARTSFMDERVLWGMVAAGALLDIATLDTSFIFPAVGLALAMLAIGWISYRTGAIGGGDVVLAVGLQLLIPFRPTEITGLFLGIIQPQADFATAYAYSSILAKIPPVASIVVAACVFGLIGTAVYYAWRVRKKKLVPDKVAMAGSLAAAAAAIYVLGFGVYLSAGALAFIAIVLAAASFLSTFRKQIFDEIIVEEITLARVEDEDILATERMDPKIVAKYGLTKLLDKAGLAGVKAMMHKEGVKTIPVAKSLPRLGPYVLFGLVVTLLLGDFLAFLMLFG